jgi:hypothetical protein
MHEVLRSTVYEISLLFKISVQEYLKEFKFEFQNELEVNLTFSKSREIAVNAEFMSQGSGRTKTRAKAEFSFLPVFFIQIYFGRCRTDPHWIDSTLWIMIQRK